MLLGSLTGGLSGDLFNLFIVNELGWDSAKLSIIYFFMLTSIPIQLLGPSLARRVGYRNMMTTGIAAMLVCLIIILFSVWFVTARISQLLLLGICAVTVEIAYSLSFGTVWSTWVSEIVPRQTRPTLMALTRILSQSSMILAFALQATVFHGHVSKVFYSLVTLTTILYVVSSLMAVKGLPAVKEQREAHTNLSSTLISILRDIRTSTANPRYRTLALDSSVQLFIGVPLIAVFMTQLIGTELRFVSLALLLQPVTSILVMIFVAKKGAELQLVRTILISGSLVAVSLTGWLVLTLFSGGTLNQLARNLAPVILVPLMFGAKALYSIMVSHFSVDVIRKDHRLAFYTFTDILSSSSLQVANSLGGLVISASMISNYRLSGVPIPAAMWIIIGLSFLLYLLSRYGSMPDTFRQEGK